jgi:hypothetical protein
VVVGIGEMMTKAEGMRLITTEGDVVPFPVQD